MRVSRIFERSPRRPHEPDALMGIKVEQIVAKIKGAAVAKYSQQPKVVRRNDRSLGISNDLK
jgi:hypothetical protein